MAHAEAALDIETGGGEVLATVARPPALLVATEGWRPNVEVARARLRPLGVQVVAAGGLARRCRSPTRRSTWW